jgi:hypothetical protein
MPSIYRNFTFEGNILNRANRHPRILVVGTLAFAAACGTKAATTTNTFLTASATAPADATCPAGGVFITSGPDTNGNGQLDPSEVKNTKELCNGTNGVSTNGAQTLTKTTPLPVGDANCPGGGSEIQLGLDNGANGSTAGDGILQDGEVQNTRYVCNGNTPLFPGSMTPPAAPAGAYTITSTGGTGTATYGGAGGAFEPYMEYGSFGGHVKVFSTGAADASFTAPTPAPNFGAEATVLTVSASKEIASYANIAAGIAAAPAADFFTVANDQNLYKNSDDTTGGTAVPVTGINITAGTLTFDPNYTSCPQYPNGSCVYLFLVNDIQNAGTISTKLDGSGNAPDLVLQLGSYYATGAVNLAGANNSPGTNGGNGGMFHITAADMIINSGTISTNGGSGDNGGASGRLHLRTKVGDIYNSGTLNAQGGTGNNGAGGYANSAYFEVGRRVYNSGTVNNFGGDGTTQGGSVDYFEMEDWNEYSGIVNSGTIDTHGGSCTDVATNCNGGSGGEISLYAYSDVLTTNAPLTTNGGKGQGTGHGGNGGEIYFYGADTSEIEEYTPGGSINVSGNLSTKGGDGAYGGSAGEVVAEGYWYYAPQGEEVVFLGYTSIDASGGGGATYGGNGGNFDMYQDEYSYSDSNYQYGPAGSVINYASFTSAGGAGAAGRGGNAGYFYMSTQDGNYFGTGFEKALNYGTVTLTGGAGTNGAGGSCGYFELFGMDGAENHKDATLTGGAATGDTYVGGSTASNSYVVANRGLALNTGTISITGGSSNGASTNAGAVSSFLVAGDTAQNSGNITMQGGAAQGATSYGGSANTSDSWTEFYYSIGLWSARGESSNTATALSTKGGAGNPSGATYNGANGTIVFDGQDVTHEFQ